MSPGNSTPSVQRSTQDCSNCGLPRAGIATAIYQVTAVANSCRCPEAARIDPVAMTQRFLQLKSDGSGDFRKSIDSVEPLTPAQSHIDLVEGSVIGGIYKIIRLIGRGGMGEVYLAQHMTLDKPCALKVIPPHKVDQVGWQRFQTEAKLFARLDHASLVRVSDLGIHDSCLPFYAMEYIDGRTLAQMLADVGPLSLGTTIEIFKQICDGVGFAHRNDIIHRDLKPDNIIIASEPARFLAKSPPRMTVKILDFGLAKLMNADHAQQSLTSDEYVWGSPYYMSPEHCKGKTTDQRSDIYSLGCALFQSLTGRPPFKKATAWETVQAHQFDTPPTLASIVGGGRFPAAVESIVAKLLEKNPDKRYQTMDALKLDLLKIADADDIDLDSTASAEPAPLFSPDPVDSYRHTESQSVSVNKDTRALILVAVICMIVGTAAVLTYIFNSPSKNKAVEHKKVMVASSTSSIDYPLFPEADKIPETKPPVPRLYEAKPVGQQPIEIWDGEPFFKGIEKYNGIELKIWQFPKLTHGTLGDVELVGDFNSPNIPLVGRVAVPVKNIAALIPDAAILQKPELLGGFTDGNFSTLKLHALTTAQFKEIGTGLRQLKSLQNLNIYNLEADDVVHPECVDVVNQFPNLTYLQIDTPMDGKDIANIRRIQMFKEIELGEIRGNVDDVFVALHGSPNLVRFLARDSHLSARTFREIGTCSNLEDLCFHCLAKREKIYGYQIAALKNLKKLTRLRLEDICYEPELLANLARCSSLKNFHCELDQPWTPEQQFALRKALPMVDTIVSWRDVNGHLQTVHYEPLKKSK